MAARMFAGARAPVVERYLVTKAKGGSSASQKSSPLATSVIASGLQPKRFNCIHSSQVGLSFVSDQIEVVDTVRLKSGGPKMTATSVGDRHGERLVWCCWFSGDEKRNAISGLKRSKSKRATFPYERAPCSRGASWAWVSTSVLRADAAASQAPAVVRRLGRLMFVPATGRFPHGGPDDRETKP
jgi:uncharacterized protein YodC (DUF2158 family)